jgi:aspartyl aminopeptidase
MHSPFEVASKGDLFETVKAYAAFYHLKLTSKR